MIIYKSSQILAAIMRYYIERDRGQEHLSTCSRNLLDWAQMMRHE